MERGAREVGDRRLERVEAVVEGEERVAAEGDDGRLLLGREDRRARRLRPHRGVLDRARLRHLATVLRSIAVALGESAMVCWLRWMDRRTACVVRALPCRTCPIARRG